MLFSCNLAIIMKPITFKSSLQDGLRTVRKKAKYGVK